MSANCLYKIIMYVLKQTELVFDTKNMSMIVNIFLIVNNDNILFSLNLQIMFKKNYIVIIPYVIILLHHFFFHFLFDNKVPKGYFLFDLLHHSISIFRNVISMNVFFFILVIDFQTCLTILMTQYMITFSFMV